MKIIIEADSIACAKMSGIGHATLEIIRELDARSLKDNNSIKIIIPFGKKDLIAKYEFKNVRVRSLPPGYKYINYLLVRTSLKFPVDILFGRGYYIFPNYKNWYVPFSKSVTFIHDVSFKSNPETVQTKNLLYMDKNIDRWIGRTNGIATISQSSASEITKYLDTKNKPLEIIHLGVNTQIFKKYPQEIMDNTLKKYRIHTKFILYVGNIEPRKNLLQLLKAYSKLPKTLQSTHALVIVGGDGWNNEDVISTIQRLRNDGLNIIKPNIFVNDKDLAHIYAAATILVHPAIIEGFGMTPLEAMAAGTPVVVSGTSSLPEVVGDAGLYVDPYKLDSISGKIELLLSNNDLLKKLGRDGHERALQFSWNITVTKLINYLKTI